MRLAELLGALALATDVGMGLPDGVALRTAYAAASLARALDLDPEETRRCYYLGLLRMMGCTAESHAAAAVMGTSWRCARRCSASTSAIRWSS